MELPRQIATLQGTATPRVAPVERARPGAGADCSLIVCSRNRASRLRIMLATLPREALTRLQFEVVLVDSAANDGTSEVMREFADAATFPVKVERTAEPGLSRARNIGLRAATGARLLFTDDDCYPDEMLFDAFVGLFTGRDFQYGGGDLYLFDPQDDPISTGRHDAPVTIAPRSLLGTGLVQGANMFFLRTIFDKLGGFREDFGAGTPFPAEDIEMCTRASLAGYVGAVLPQLRVLHHHGRRPGTPELQATLEGYDRGRGAYFALLIGAGLPVTWKMWSDLSPPGPLPEKILRRLEREFRGAADFLASKLVQQRSDRRDAASPDAVTPADLKLAV